MAASYPIIINNNNCTNCYRCVRECEVKAINFNQSNPRIDPQRCIMCGNCIDICPTSAITIESNIEKVKIAIKNNKKVIASLSSGWKAEFKNISEQRIIEALKLLGFSHVSETALGATLLEQKSAKILASSKGYFISSVCPVANRIISRYYPQLTDHIIKLPTPVVAHASMLKEIYGDDTLVVTIDSCVASKILCYNKDNNLYAAITFDELEKWLEEEDINFEMVLGNSTYHFEPTPSTENNLYISPRGVYNHHYLNKHHLTQHSVYDYDGIWRLHNILDSLQKEDAPNNTFLELFACEGGCTTATGCIDKVNLITKRAILSRYEYNEEPQDMQMLPVIDLKSNYEPTGSSSYVSEVEIADTLESLFMDINSDPINCGGCGYRDCRSFAKALATHQTVPDICMHYQKHLAQNRFTSLIAQLHAGVAEVDNSLNIVEANRSFARLFGPDAIKLYDSNPGMNGVNIKQFVHISDWVTKVLRTGKELVFEQIQIRNETVKFTIIPLLKQNTVGILARSSYSPYTKNDQIIDRTKEIINKNFETVQKIAFLLGENASQTEAVLNSIIESQKENNDR